ncbi:MAG TPA: Uma2 family endonuclease [Chloroflexota bacterium]|nr:Uma2 family endonuclease [Chloroflexota bacterium]
MTAHRRPAHAPAPDLSSEDLLALRRQSPDYVPPPPAPVSWEEFLAWAPDDWRVEWVAGEIIEMPPSNIDDLDTSSFLLAFLLLYIQRHGLGRVFHAGALVKLAQKPSGREPDLVFVRRENLDRIKPTWVDGPVDLAVEIVSPDSVTRDYRDKLAEYQAAGIPEYWIIDPRRSEARFYQLGDDGTYRLSIIGEDGIYTSRVVEGFRLRVSWLWQRPLPTIDEALADLDT